MKSQSFIKSLGFFTINFHLFLHTIPQLILVRILTEDYHSIYRFEPMPTVVPILYLLTFVLTVYALDALLPVVSLKIKFKNFQGLFFTILIASIVIFFISAVYFYTHFDISYRHTHRLRDTGAMVKIVFLIRDFMLVFVFACLAKAISGVPVKLWERWALFVLAICFFLSLSASLDLPMVILILVLAFTPDSKYKMFFWKSNMSRVKKLLIWSVVIALTIPVLLGTVWIGVANKIGAEAAMLVFLDQNLFIELVIEVALRVSTYLISFYTGFNEMFNLQLQFEILHNYWVRFLQRLNTLFSLFPQLDADVLSLNRHNYYATFIHNEAPFAGASPGLLASTFYLPFFPLGIALIAGYVLVIVRAFNRFIPVPFKELNMFTKLIAIFFIGPLLNSPVDLLGIIEPRTLTTVFFVLYSIVFHEMYYSSSREKESQKLLEKPGFI